MDELALYVLDITYNSIRAKATLITIDIEISTAKDLIKIVIEDNGSGMDEETLNNVINPFYTTRTTRNVGLGIPMFKEAALMSEGTFEMFSKKNEGTKVEASFKKNHIDTPIMGNLVETILTLIQANDSIDYVFRYKNDDNQFVLDTKEIKEILQDVKINEPDIIVWLKEYIKEGING